MPSLTQTLLLALTTTLSTTVLASPIASATTTTRAAGTYTGDITYYQPGLGACGQTNTDGEAVVAMNAAQYAGSCGRMIAITSADGSRKAVAKVVDKCPACASGAIDVSSSVFQLLADLSVGRTTVSWSFE